MRTCFTHELLHHIRGAVLAGLDRHVDPLAVLVTNMEEDATFWVECELPVSVFRIVSTKNNNFWLMVFRRLSDVSDLLESKEIPDRSSAFS